MPLLGVCLVDGRTCVEFTPFMRETFYPSRMPIKHKLIPAITDMDAPSPLDWRWLGLPVLHGRLSLFDPFKFSVRQYTSSSPICSPLIDSLISQAECLSHGEMPLQYEYRKECLSNHKKQLEAEVKDISQFLPQDRRRLLELASEKGSSAWLSAPPLQDHGFTLNKQFFHNALCFRFGWRPPLLPIKCVCGSGFTVEHALSCLMGGMQNLRHNELRDLTAQMLRKVCHNVTVEPALQPVSGRFCRVMVHQPMKVQDWI